MNTTWMSIQEEIDTPIHVAARCGNEAVAFTLLNEFHCNVSSSSRTVLYCACIGGGVSLVKTLLKMGLGKDRAPDFFPLHVAAESGKKS